MATIKQQYGTTTEVTGLTTLSLADGSGATSSAIDNGTNLFLGADLEITMLGLAGSVDTVDVYLIGSVDDGTDFATTELANMLFVGSIELNGTTEVIKVIRIEQLPSQWKLRIINNSGAALSATEADCSIYYRGTSLTNA